VIGDKPIDSYVREDANNLRDVLPAKALSRASIRRTVSLIRLDRFIEGLCKWPPDGIELGLEI
jgi:hypothetical protein